MDSTNHDLPGTDQYDDEPATGISARRRWPWAVGALALVGAAFAGGVAVAENFGSTDAGRSAVSSPSVMAPTASADAGTTPSPTGTTPSPSPTGTAPVTIAPSTSATATPAPPAASWQTFTSPGGKISFEHPAAWRVAPPAGAGSGAVDVDVSDEAGMVVASLHAGPTGGIGGACQGPVPYTVLDSVEVDIPYQPTKGSVTPRFTFRALQEADRVTASYGLTSFVAGQDGTTCMFYNAINGPAWSPLFSFADTFQVNAGGTEQVPNRKGAKTFPSLEAARAYMQTPEYLNAKRMLTSVKVSAG
ncbi:hypothetical protein [Arthrobacter sp. UYEF3]|uniref:hypothetical protein n=1 Tax=Arthrobacter sp. UYEF3 TaxID=1756365 RepID=UPI003390E453